MKKPPFLSDIGRLPELDESLETLFCWLSSRDLVVEGRTMDLQPIDIDKQQLIDGTAVTLAKGTGRQRANRKTSKEMKALKERFKEITPSDVTNDAVWVAVKNPSDSVRSLDWSKLPADAMAFNRPFHYPPFDQWGIYLLIDPLLRYHKRLRNISKDLNLFSNEVLMHLVLFEVFNHEFFHHLAESTATSLEILAAAQGNVRSVYLDYKRKQHNEKGFEYPHHPLEEALANAYAHNALSFICRIKAGYKTATVKSYQEALKKHWRLEPPGYRDAAFYIDSAYVPGGAHLLAQMLGAPEAVDTAPLSCLAKHLMPNGFTALMQKPDIPTYLVGNEEELRAFHELVPTPNEAYTQLFWLFNTDYIDGFVRDKKEEERRMKQRKRKTSVK